MDFTDVGENDFGLRVVVDVSRLGETDDGVDEDVGLTISGGANGEFAMGSVHRVTSLERYDLAPCELLEVCS